MGFYTLGTSGTVTGTEEYDAEAACKKLYEGMKGLGTDEKAVVEVIASHTNVQRQEIKDKYKTMYGKDLAEDLEGELGGSFAKIVLALMKEPEEYIIDSINQAITGLGTDTNALIGLLCTRTNEELEEIKKAYKEKYEKEMEEDVAEDLSGDFRSLIVGIINGGRDESEEVDSEKVQEDAKNLLEASEGAGTREEVFQSIFNQRSYEHMRQVFDAYKELAEGKEIEELIESEFSGSLQACYLALVKIFRNVSEFYAERLRNAVKGAGTDDEDLIRIIVLRSEVDLKDVIDIYQAKYESSLGEDVSSDTSGDYKLILERLLTPTTEAEVVEEEVTAKDAGEGEEAVPSATEGEENVGKGDEGGDEGGDAAESAVDEGGEEATEKEFEEEEKVECEQATENCNAAAEEEAKEEGDAGADGEETPAENGEETPAAEEDEKADNETDAATAKEDGEDEAKSEATENGDAAAKEENGAEEGAADAADVTADADASDATTADGGEDAAVDDAGASNE